MAVPARSCNVATIRRLVGRGVGQMPKSGKESEGIRIRLGQSISWNGRNGFEVTVSPGDVTRGLSLVALLLQPESSSQGAMPLK